MEEGQFTQIEIAIIAHAKHKRGKGCMSSGDWPVMGSDVSPHSNHPSAYGLRFRNVFQAERGIYSFEEWVDDFRSREERDPFVLELMGNSHLLVTLGVPGIFVNWTPDYHDNVYKDGQSRLEINCDMEQIPRFMQMLRQALNYLGIDDGVDLLVWKGEGALGSLLNTDEAYKYWWGICTDLLKPTGSAFIQSPLVFDWSVSFSSAVKSFQKLQETRAQVVYATSVFLDSGILRIDKF